DRGHREGRAGERNSEQHAEHWCSPVGVRGRLSLRDAAPATRDTVIARERRSTWNGNAMATLTFRGGTVILEDRLLAGAEVEVTDGRIPATNDRPTSGANAIDLDGGYLAPGYVDLHVHGGDGSDFMDGTPEAFRAACRAHARHGTTSLLPTCTVASHEQ